MIRFHPADEVTQACLALGTLALFLDFDGTLVDIAPTPDAISVSDELPALLQGLAHRLEGRLALVTGRSHADLSRYLDLTPFWVASTHGAERSRPGQTDTNNLHDGARLDPFRQTMTRLSGACENTVLEDKGTALALHTRANPAAHAPLLAAVKTAHPDDDVHISEGKGIIEVRLAAYNKGVAVRDILRDAAWQTAKPVMIGDDTTDRDAMRACEPLGGFGVQVGQGPTGAAFPEARFHMAAVQDVYGVLRALA